MNFSLKGSWLLYTLIFVMLLFNFFLLWQNRKLKQAIFQENYSFQRKSSIVTESLVFKYNKFNFGKLLSTDQAKVDFDFTNISSKPVKIINVMSTCSCTQAKWPESKIGPGASSKITIEYDTRITGAFDKIVLVNIENENDPIRLNIIGNVIDEK